MRRVAYVTFTLLASYTQRSHPDSRAKRGCSCSRASAFPAHGKPRQGALCSGADASASSFLSLSYALVFSRSHKPQRVFSLTARFLPRSRKLSPSLARVTASYLSVSRRTKARPTAECDLWLEAAATRFFSLMTKPSWR